jgi:hypothetical protein
MQVEEYLVSEQISSKREVYGLVIDEQPGVCASITIVEQGEEGLIAQVGLLVNIERIKRSDELFEALQGSLKGGKEGFKCTYDIRLDSVQSEVWFSSSFMEDDLEDEFECFLGLVNYCILPLFIHIEETGEWNDTVLWLAFLNPDCPEDMSNA